MEKKEDKNKNLRILIFVGLILAMVYMCNDPKGNLASTPEPAKSDRQILLDKQFSVWDGSHRGLEKQIKASMNDPESYEHVSTQFKDMTDYIIVTTSFRGKNAFGGTVLNSVTAKCDLQGNVLEITE
jgi:hypothetical protein